MIKMNELMAKTTLKLAVFLRCQLNPILNPSDTLNAKKLFLGFHIVEFCR